MNCLGLVPIQKVRIHKDDLQPNHVPIEVDGVYKLDKKDIVFTEEVVRPAITEKKWKVKR